MALSEKTWVYRLTHRDNLIHILEHGICNRNHPNANPHYIAVGHKEIIGKRKEHPVKIESYGNVGDYVPFYFTPKSIMLYNILTGYGVQKFNPEELIIMASTVTKLSACGKNYFFTNGQANTSITKHLNDLSLLDEVDWEVIRSGDFKKTITDIDRPRRYQAEFLVYSHVPVNCIEAIAVYNESCATFVKRALAKTDRLIPVYIKKSFYFNR